MGSKGFIKDRENLLKRASGLDNSGSSGNALMAGRTTLGVASMQKALVIPVTVFDNDQLSALEAVVKYMHENLGYRLTDIAKQVNRDQRAIGVTYRFAVKKLTVMMKITRSRYKLPLGVLSDRRLSVLEGIAFYLKNNYSLSYHDIALLLNRDDRTIWTVYNRALTKLGKK